MAVLKLSEDLTKIANSRQTNYSMEVMRAPVEGTQAHVTKHKDDRYVCGWSYECVFITY